VIAALISPAHPTVAGVRMSLRPLLALLAFLAAWFLATASASASEAKDLVVLKVGDQKKMCFIETETADGKLLYRNTMTDKEPKSYRLNELRSWEYAEMRDGHWPKAVEARDAGNYGAAADLFNAVAVTGAKEWQKIYGAYQEGACWELLGQWDKAAESFARAGSVRPGHRLSVDAKYRQGFALARAKKDAEATTIATELEKIAKDSHNAAADLRSHAIRAALAFNAGAADVLKKEGNLANFNQRDDTDAFLQFGIFYADALRQLKLPRDAKIQYQRLLEADLDPAEKIALALGFAKLQLDEDKPSALATLLRIDALPYGSADQKCEVRYLAGSLLAEEVKAARATPPSDEAAQLFAKDQERTARLLLGAAAGSSSAIQARDLAKIELDGLGPDPEAPPKVEAKPEAPVKDANPKK